MRLAISNIAWRREEEHRASRLLQALGVRFVEIAPTKIWLRPTDIGEPEASSYSNWWRARGIEIVAMQSLLFGTDGLALFETAEQRRRLLHHLEGMMRLASWLQATRLVFGSPANRRRNGLSHADADDIARPFFHRAGDIARRYGVQLCLEPIPQAYGCDYINTIGEAVQLVTSVNHPWFRLQLDTGQMTLSREDPATVLPAALGCAGHFHISEPFLRPIGAGGVDHEAIANVLRVEGWKEYVSVEMRCEDSAEDLSRVKTALAIASAVYDP